MKYPPFTQNTKHTRVLLNHKYPSRTCIENISIIHSNKDLKSMHKSHIYHKLSPKSFTHNLSFIRRHSHFQKLVGCFNNLPLNSRLHDKVLFCKSQPPKCN